MQNVLGMYSRAPLGDSSEDYPALVLLYTDASLRYGQFLFSIWASKGWSPMAFLTMLSGNLPPPFTSAPLPKARLFRLTSRTTITRTQIASIIGLAHGPWLMHLRPPDRLRVLSTLAKMYSCIGFERKEAFILRELLAVIMDLITVSREENRDHAMSATPESASGSGGSVAVREQESAEGNDSLLRLVSRVCDVYGVRLDAVKVYKGGTASQPEIEEDEDDRADYRASFGWPALQVDVIGEAIVVAENLPGM